MEELRINSPYCQALNDLFEHFDINSVPKKLRDRMHQSFTKTYMSTLDFIDSGEDTIEDFIEQGKKILKESKENGLDVFPLKEAVSQVINRIPMIETIQFKTVSNNGIESLSIDNVPDFWVQPAFSFIPDVYMNLSIVDEIMSYYGYIRVRKTRKLDKEGRSWWYIVYNPDPKDAENVYRLLVKNHILLHLTPDFNTQSILQNGLIPSHGGRTYEYPDERVFFYVTDYYHPFKFKYKFKRMMGGITKKEKANHPQWDEYFDIFELLLHEMPADTKIYWDPNAQDGVYLKLPIQPKYLDLHKDRRQKFI